MKNFDNTSVSLLISETNRVSINLVPGRYNRLNFANSKFIMYSPLSRSDSTIPHHGMIIMEKQDKKWILLGSLLPLITNLKMIQISDFSKQKKVTHGDSITLSHKEGVFILVDEFKRRLALGKIKMNQFTPICDIGSYLRYET